MRVTRKALQAYNDQLRAQIAVHNHVTRSSLHDMIRMTRERNEHLIEEYKKLERAYAGLQEVHAALVASTESATASA